MVLGKEKMEKGEVNGKWLGFFYSARAKPDWSTNTIAHPTNQPKTPRRKTLHYGSGYIPRRSGSVKHDKLKKIIKHHQKG